MNFQNFLALYSLLFALLIVPLHKILQNIDMTSIRTIFIAFCAAILTACINSNGDVERLKAENDSLKIEKQQMEQEVDAYLKAINTIQDNIERIKQMENVITVEPIGETMNDDQIQKVNEDIRFLNDMLRSNREELKRLQNQLKNSSLKIGQLEKSIQALTARLEQETKKVAQLEHKLAEKNALIMQMTDTINMQSRQIEQLTTQTIEQQQQIEDKDHKIASAWYVFGTKKELKQQGIISTSGFSKRVLEDDFNKDYFVKIDARQTTSIPLYASHAKILTNHPKSSYTLEKENDRFILIITDAQAFWSVSRYLVVEVD